MIPVYQRELAYVSQTVRESLAKEDCLVYSVQASSKNLLNRLCNRKADYNHIPEPSLQDWNVCPSCESKGSATGLSVTYKTSQLSHNYKAKDTY